MPAPPSAVLVHVPTLAPALLAAPAPTAPYAPACPPTYVRPFWNASSASTRCRSSNECDADADETVPQRVHARVPISGAYSSVACAPQAGQSLASADMVSAGAQDEREAVQGLGRGEMRERAAVGRLLGGCGTQRAAQLRA